MHVCVDSNFLRFRTFSAQKPMEKGKQVREIRPSDSKEESWKRGSKRGAGISIVLAC